LFVFFIDTPLVSSRIDPNVLTLGKLSGKSAKPAVRDLWAYRRIIARVVTTGAAGTGRFLLAFFVAGFLEACRFFFATPLVFGRSTELLAFVGFAFAFLPFVFLFVCVCFTAAVGM
tara:strand:- start:39041 stop:39388 length:348 start_codon:yes stop_codon:yes gene_type:complete